MLEGDIVAKVSCYSEAETFMVLWDYKYESIPNDRKLEHQFDFSHARDSMLNVRCEIASNDAVHMRNIFHGWLVILEDAPGVRSVLNN